MSKLKLLTVIHRQLDIAVLAVVVRIPQHGDVTAIRDIQGVSEAEVRLTGHFSIAISFWGKIQQNFNFANFLVHHVYSLHVGMGASQWFLVSLVQRTGSFRGHLLSSLMKKFKQKCETEFLYPAQCINV